MVKSKFKNTDIGQIPADWNLIKIGDSFAFKNGLNKEKEFFGFGYPIVNYMDVYKNTHIDSFKIAGKVFVTNQELKNFNTNKGDVLFTRTSETQEDIASSAVITDFLKNTVFSGFVLRARPFNNFFDIGYCRYVFSNSVVREQIKATSTYTTRALTNGRVLSEIKIPLPPLPEQKAIAEVISETDVWINNLEGIIAKKKNIKLGVMQKLLVPNENWEIKKLGEIGNTIGGLSGKTKNDFGKGSSFYIPFMNIMKNVIIDKNYLDTVNIKSGEFQNKILKNDLLFNGSSETPDELGISSVLLDSIDNLYLNSFSFGFRVSENSNVHPLFLSYLMRSSYGRKVIYHLAQGATRYNLSKANFLKLEIAFPKSIKEQINIASLLSDMDTEIANLEKKLKKAKQLKQGMMQQLLSGKIRLVNTLQTS